MHHDPLAFSHHALPSGLRVYHHHRPLGFTGCQVMIGAGSRHDPPGKEELMHLLEHLVSTGTRGMPAMSLVELERWIKQQRFDVSLGETQLDFSAYEGKTATPRFGALLRFLHDLVLRPTLDSSLEKEREIIRREREEAASPEERATEAARRRAVYGSHRLATCGGWAEDAVLDGLTLDDARAAHAAHYHPANMALIVVGGIDEDALLREVEATFSEGPTGHVPPRPDPLALAVPDPREYVQKKDGGRVHKVDVRYHWHLPRAPRGPLIVTRNGLAETLLDRIRERLHATYGVDVHDEPYADHTAFTIATHVSPKKVDVARLLIEETVRDAAALAAATPRLKDERTLALELLELGVDETIDMAAMQLNVSGRTSSVREILAAVDETRPEDVERLVATHLAPERAYVELVEE